MTRDRDAKPRSELKIVRIGGGASARLVALVVVGVLAAVVWVGMSNRPPAVGTAQTQPPAAAASRSIPAATPAPMLTPRTTVPPETYGVSATIGNRSYVAALDELRPGHMAAILRVPIPPDAGSGVLTITQLWAAEVWNNPVVVGDWTMPLDPLFTGNRDPELIIEAAMPARPKRDDVPPKLRSGFELRVYAQNDLLFGIISIEVTLNPLVTT